MNVYVLKVNLKEAEYGGYKFIEPERTVLELASDDNYHCRKYYSCRFCLNILSCRINILYPKKHNE